MNDQEPLFFENLEAALAHVVQRLGGSGRVGPLLFPGKNGRAAQHLNDCLNPKEREKLDLGELMHLLKLGREMGCHSGLRYINSELGYRPPDPVDPVDEKAEIEREFVDSVRRLEKMLERHERAVNSSLRVVK